MNKNNQEFSYLGGPKKYFKKKIYVGPKVGKKSVKSDKKPTDIVWLSNVIDEFRGSRLRQRLSQQAVANQLKTGQAFISRFENKKVNPTVEFLDRYLRLLGLEIKIEIK
jgi:predicted transcriptional regulator